jgi:hypothetical protein
LGSLAAVGFFQQKGDESAWRSALAALNEERQLSRDLNALGAEAEQLFAALPVDEAKEQILQQLAHYPTYRRQFDRQIRGQHPATVLEAKLSHDLVYYRYFDRIAALAERAPNLKTLIDDLKSLPADSTPKIAEKFLQGLSSRYAIAAN